MRDSAALHDNGRAERTTAFLAAAGWGGALRQPLAGDASARRYERLRDGGRTAILMDAPPGTGNDVAPFCRIARHLAALGLSAPGVLHQDAEHGFLLLEDLGDGLFARVIARQPHLEPPLYRAAVGVLAKLHRHPAPPGIAALTPQVLGEMIAPAFEWYAPALTGRSNAAAAVGAEIARLAAQIAPETPVLALRDYHAENLLWLPARTDPAQVGLLDFQDAVAGHPAYDLVSLVQDARRDVAPAVQAAAIAQYAALTGQGPGFGAALALLGAQRNLRILGVFARLWLQQGKPQYLGLIPRVWGHLRRNLAHPALAPLALLLGAHLPEPTPERLQSLRNARTDPVPR